MESDELQLADAPTEQRDLELWLQHAAGFILFEDVRGYARSKIDPSLPPQTRLVAEKAIDDALYGLMMVLDGVTGSLSGTTTEVNLRTRVRLVTRPALSPSAVIAELDLFEGDGMCIGYHGWLENDFGRIPIVKARRRSEASGRTKPAKAREPSAPRGAVRPKKTKRARKTRDG